MIETLEARLFGKTYNSASTTSTGTCVDVEALVSHFRHCQVWPAWDLNSRLLNTKTVLLVVLPYPFRKRILHAVPADTIRRFFLISTTLYPNLFGAPSLPLLLPSSTFGSKSWAWSVCWASPLRLLHPMFHHRIVAVWFLHPSRVVDRNGGTNSS